MKRKDIDGIFSALVRDYMENGYAINTNTMSGHQGEIAKVDLMKDGVFLRVSLFTDHDFERYYDCYVLTVGKTTEYIRESDYQTVWMDNLETVWQKRYIKVGKNWYLADEDEAKACLEKRRVRDRNGYHRGTTFVLPESCVKIALNRVRKIKGLKSTKKGDIKEVRRVVRKGESGTVVVTYDVVIGHAVREIGRVVC